MQQKVKAPEKKNCLQTKVPINSAISRDIQKNVQKQKSNSCNTYDYENCEYENRD